MCEFKNSKPYMFKSIFSIWFTAHLMTCSALDVTQSNNILANRLHAILIESNNILCSPISIHSMLSMCYQGASGSTKGIMQGSLKLPDPQSVATQYKEIITHFATFNEIKLYMVNNIYFAKDYKINAEFAKVTSNYFMADIEELDFTQASAVAHINKWVNEKTLGKIDDVIAKGDVDHDTRMLAINVIYFKASWKYPFPSSMTHQAVFYISEHQTVMCDMMKMIHEYFYKENKELDAKLIRIPYRNSKMNLFIILPNSKSGIFELERKLAKCDIINVTKGMILTEVVLSLPKFKIEASMELNKPLMQMGLQNIFSDSADFSNMVDSGGPIKMSKIVHKAFMEVSENGTVAAAATGVIARRRRSVNPFQAEFNANRPFIYYVIHSDTTIIFLGTLIQPITPVVHDEL